VTKPTLRRIGGIDIGGTFTDLLLYAERGDGPADIHLVKVPTRVEDRGGAVLDALQATGVPLAELDLIIHGTTATTNAVLERKVAQVGLITTRGFRDILELGRRTRPQPYGMTGVFEPLVGREHRLEVTERMTANGLVHTPLDEAEVAGAARRLLAAGCEAVVIHFLHAYANPAHEQRAGEIVRALWPNRYVTRATELLSEFREYERGTTAAVNAAVQPILDRYLGRLQADLATGGYGRELLIMSGNGGTVPAERAVAEAAKTVMSGPASGVMAAAATLAMAGIANAITYDMGGTSTDVALIHGGLPEVSSELQIDYGLPIHVPMVDVRTIGAGGGSIAALDAAGLLKVGPESAGAKPGPIGFGRGGTRPTITDANLLLGRLPANRLTAVQGAVALERVREVFEVALARPLGLSVETAAAAVVQLGNLAMAGAIRLVSLARGHDPRDFVLFAFGGAGPLHAVAVARELGIPEVLVPARPGMTNALGCLVADLRQDYGHTLNVPLDAADMAQVAARFAEDAERGRAANASAAGDIIGTQVLHAVEMQFRGQTHLLRIPLTGAEPTRDDLQQLFEAAYFRRFQVKLPEVRAQLVNLTTTVIGRRQPIPLDGLLDPARAAATLAGAETGRRALWADGRFVEAVIYDRERLPRDATFQGPAIVEQIDATTVIEPGVQARVDVQGNLRLRV
jgi:N-methylhydantoinase A